MNPRPIPEDWTQISRGDTVVPSSCNHVGMVDRYNDMGTCGNCLAQWCSPGFLAGVRAGIKAMKEGKTSAWEDVKRELGIGEGEEA